MADVRLVPPPTHMEAPETAVLVFTVMVVGGVLAALAWCVRESLRDRDPVPVLAIVGALIAALMEAMYDVAFLVFYPLDTTPVAYTAFGRVIPVFLVAGYGAFIGFGSYSAYRLIKRRKGARALWGLAAGVAVVLTITEIPAIHLGLWAYYGDQPFRLFGFPVFYSLLNAAWIVLAGWLFFLLAGRLRGWGRLLLVMVPATALGLYAAIGWPVALTLNANVPQGVVWLAATLSAGLAVCVIWLVASATDAARTTPPVAADAGEPSSAAVSPP